MAKREQKPIFLNNDMFRYTFRRNHEGDYHCTGSQVKAMIRDQPENTMDMKVLDLVPMSDLNYETIRGYRNRHRVMKPGHPFERLSDEEYLRSIGAAAISDEDHELHPTAAGMLMFGDEYNIVRQYPEYFLDYREIKVAKIKVAKIVGFPADKYDWCRFLIACFCTISFFRSVFVGADLLTKAERFFRNHVNNLVLVQIEEYNNLVLVRNIKYNNLVLVRISSYNNLE